MIVFCIVAEMGLDWSSSSWSQINTAVYRDVDPWVWGHLICSSEGVVFGLSVLLGEVKESLIISTFYVIIMRQKLKLTRW